MALPSFTMRQLLEAGVHFGHRTQRWNPRMAPYLFGERNGISIIDLRQTVPMLYQAMQAVRDIVAGNGRVLFVGTKRQATQPISEAAAKCGQYFVNHRWLGGTLTNWKTISVSIKRLKDLDDQFEKGETQGLTKKELLKLTREREKLDRSLGGIKDMGGLPDVLVIIDTNKEDIAVKEAVKLGIPVVAVLDSNSSPDGITYPVPGNDDALRAVSLYCELFSGAVLDGLQAELAAHGDLGEAEELPAEELPSEELAAEAEAATAAPAEEAPAEAAPAEETPAEAAPAEEPKAEEAPAEEAKAEEAPAEETKAEEAPQEEPEAEEAPAAEEAAAPAEAEAAPEAAAEDKSKA